MIARNELGSGIKKDQLVAAAIAPLPPVDDAPDARVRLDRNGAARVN